MNFNFNFDFDFNVGGVVAEQIVLAYLCHKQPQASTLGVGNAPRNAHRLLAIGRHYGLPSSYLPPPSSLPPPSPLSPFPPACKLRSPSSLHLLTFECELTRFPSGLESCCITGDESPSINQISAKTLERFYPVGCLTTALALHL